MPAARKKAAAAAPVAEAVPAPEAEAARMPVATPKAKKRQDTVASIFHDAQTSAASRPWPSPAAARPGLMAPRSASMALQASAPGELRGALGRLGYLCAEGGKAMFVAAADLSML